MTSTQRARESIVAPPQRPAESKPVPATIGVVAMAPGRGVRLFGLDLCDTTRDEAALSLVGRAMRGERSRVSFINAHCVNVMYRDAAYREALQQSDGIFVDGSGMMIAARAAGITLRENLNGTDLFPVLCRRAAETGQGIYLFGGADGVAGEAGARMGRDIPGLRVSGSHHGYVGTAAAEDEVIASINGSGARIVLVGLGVPRQELWIARNHRRLEAPVLIGVGGLFDYYSGRIPRAPMLLRQSGLEWVWRMAMEPRRLAGRYLLGNAEFLIRLMRLRLAVPTAFDQRGLT